MTRASHYPGPVDGRTDGPALAQVRDLDLFDVLGLAWAERGLIALVFAVLFATGVAGAFLMLKPSYEAETRLLVLLNEDPTPAAAGMGGAFMIDQVMQSESELLGSEAVRRLALDTLGAERVLGEAVDGDGRTAALKALRGGFDVSRAPQSSVLSATFSSDDAERSALILNAIVDAYLAYREQILIETGASGLGERRAQADIAVAETQAALDAFLREHNLSNFETEKATMETLIGNLTDRVNTARASRDAALAGAAALRERIAQIPDSIELYVENGVTGLLLDRRAERASLMSRYQAGAPAVQAIDREIAAIESFLAEGGTEGAGARRTGPNPVRQDLESELATRQANARSEASLVTSLESQLQENRREVARLRGLEAEYVRLSQDVTAAQAASGTLAGLEATAASRRSTGLGSADAVRVVDRATPPLEGSSLKKIGVIAAFVLAAGAALFLGLLRGYWRHYVRADALSVPRPRPANDAPLHPVSQPTPIREVANDPFDGLPVLARIADRSA